MGRTNKYSTRLDEYARRSSKLLNQSESVTSHLLLSKLYYQGGIYPWDVVPQPNCKRGIIDFFYLPRDKSFNVFIEMKKFLSLNQKKSDRASKYMKGPFPEALDLFNRIDGIRLLLVTDLRNIGVSVRQKGWGKTSRLYSLPLVQTHDVNDCTKRITDWLGRSSGKCCRLVIWDDQKNRQQVVLKELNKGYRSELYKLIYTRWLKRLDCNGGPGWPKKFKRAYKVQCNMLKKYVPPQHLEKIVEVFNEARVKEIVKKRFELLGVTFRRGRLKSMFG